jgi:hypothetical protein
VLARNSRREFFAPHRALRETVAESAVAWDPASVILNPLSLLPAESDGFEVSISWPGGHPSSAGYPRATRLLLRGWPSVISSDRRERA